MVKTGFCAMEISAPSPYQGHCSPIFQNLLNCSKTCKAQDVLYFRAAIFKASDTLYLRFDDRYTSAGYA
jgi:hypothetical protein